MTHKDNSLQGDSLNITEQRKKELKQLFPGAFTETKNDKGEIVETLDFERLKAELGEFSEIYDNRRERYGMDWPGKKDCLRLIQEPSRATLNPCREESVDFDTTQNLFIEGDNLEVLKLLQKSYYGEVKMIYIDPPYNTGKEFIYPDNYSESLDTYLEYAGLKEKGGDGRKWSTNSQNEGRFHTKWLNMMYPRLYLARNLLREDGVIFISIDDNEVENLRRMCDEIFGEENFIAQIIWEKIQTRKNSARYFSESHDYILCYARNKEKWKRKLIPREGDTYYSNPNNDPRGPWKLDRIYANNPYAADYKIKNPITGEIYSRPQGKFWRYSEETIKSYMENGQLIFSEKPGSYPNVKRYLSEVQDGLVPTTLFDRKFAGDNGLASRELTELLGMEKAFDYPKPTKLILRLLQIGADEGDVVMDFFSGSATTGHACFQYSCDLKKSVKFVLVQLPEPMEELPAGLPIKCDSISDLSKERLRRSIKKMRTKDEGQLDLRNNANPDLGFKVLKLNQSNFKQWQSPTKDISDEELVKQFELNVDHVDPNTPKEYLLYELLIKAGVKPTEKIETIELAGHSLYSVDDGILLIHLENDIEASLIDAIVEKAPQQFICLDSAFHGNDQLKTNAAKTFEAYNQGKESIDRIEFLTV